MYDVIIIGAGYAGVAAAKALKEAGITNFLVLEKNSTVGGRADVFKVSDEYFGPSGQEFITPRYKNLWRVAKDLNLNLQEITNKDIIFINKHQSFNKGNSVRINPKKLLAFFLFSNKIPYSFRIKFITRLFKLRKYKNYSSLYELFEDLIGKEFTQLFIDTIINTTWGYSAKKADPEYFMKWFKNTSSGKVYTIENGISQILLNLYAQIGKDKFKLNSNVTKIELDKSKEFVSVSYIHQQKITNANAKYIVATTPTPISKKFIQNPNKDLGLILQTTEYSLNIRVFCTTSEDLSFSYVYVPRSVNKYIQGFSVIPGKSDHKLSKFSISIDGKNADNFIGKNNEEILDQLIELGILEIPEIPKDFKVQGYVHWENALPIYSKDHVEKIKVYKSKLDEIANERILLAGDMIGGPYAEGAYKSGVESIEPLLAKLKP